MKIVQTRLWLSEKYGVDPRTIKKWLKDAGITHRGALKPLDLELFLAKTGDPARLAAIQALLSK